MSEATTFIRNQIENAMLQLNTAMPCKVLSFNESTKKAKIKPLFMSKTVDGEPFEQAAIDDVPVLFQRFKHIDIDNGSNTVTQEFMPVLKPNDIVYVVFSQRALDNVLTGKVAYPNINRHHSLKDAVIVGIIS